MKATQWLVVVLLASCTPNVVNESCTLNSDCPVGEACYGGICEAVPTSGSVSTTGATTSTGVGTTGATTGQGATTAGATTASATTVGATAGSTTVGATTSGTATAVGTTSGAGTTAGSTTASGTTAGGTTAAASTAGATTTGAGTTSGHTTTASSTTSGTTSGQGASSGTTSTSGTTGSTTSGAVGAGSLLNLQYGVSQASTITGPAAFGLGPSDVWNGMNGPTQGNSSDFVTSPLLWSDGTQSPVSCETKNLPGVWGGFMAANGSALFSQYDYSGGEASAQVELTGLPAGSYEIYAYADLWAGNNVGFGINVYSPSQTTLDALSALYTSSTVDPVTWVEGDQYVVQGNVCVATGDKVEVTLVPGVQGAGDTGCFIQGLQILQTAAGSCAQVDAGTTLTTLISGNQYTMNVAIDSANVYWIDYSTQLLRRMPKGGGAAVTIAQGLSGAQGGLAVDSQFAYWTESTGNTVRKVSTDGGTPVTLASGQTGASGVAIDDANVYWANRAVGGTIMQASKIDGSNPIVLYNGDGGYPLSIAVEGQTVYWTSNNTPSGVLGNGSVNAVPVGGGTNVVLSSAGIPDSVVANGNAVYWTDWGNWTCCNWDAMDGVGEVWTLPNGSSTPVLIASGQSQPGALAIDGQNAYWTNYRNGSAASSPLDGGVSDVMLSWGFCAGGIAVDSSGVYFTDCGSIYTYEPAP